MYSPTTINIHDHLSEENNSHLMDDLMNDLEAGISSNQPRHVNKKMKKRKQLDALLKFRSLRSNRNSTHRSSHEALLTSEDELFLPEQKTTPIKSSLRYRKWWNYTRHILSFCLVCIFMIVCVGLAYANIELKTEVQNLSLRVTEIEKRFSSFEINRLISTIEQIKNRLNVIERWNVSYIYDRLHKLQIDFNHIKRNTSVTDEDVDVSSKLDAIEQKSTDLNDVAEELEKLSRDADNQATDVISENTKSFNRKLIEHLLEQEKRENAHQDTTQLSKNILSLNESLYQNTIKWNDELRFLRNEVENLNQTVKIQELSEHFQELTNLVHNSSDKTSLILTSLQLDLAKLRNQTEACKCSKEPVPLKPSIVETETLKQTIIAKPNTVESSSVQQTDHNNTLDIAQIVNPSP